MTGAPDVSVCIATCRRPRGLARLLASLAGQKLPDGTSLEVIVVDDDPGQQGVRVVEDLDGFPHALVCLSEAGRNIARARNRAIEAASGRFLAFVDDDEVADEDWLAAYLAAQAERPEDGWFGPVLPRLERPGAAWLDPEIFFARSRHPSGTRASPRDFRTSNAFVRRALFDGSRFDPALGRSGGSDTELFMRLSDAGARFAWCDEAKVAELVPSERHRLGWLSRRAFRGGCVSTRLEGRRSARAVRAGLAGVALAAALPFAALFGRTRAARVWLRLCVQAGHLWAHTGRGYEEYA